MDQNYRKRLIQGVTFAAGSYFVLDFVLPESWLKAVGVAEYDDQIMNGFIAVGAVAFGLGLINLFMVHGARVVFAKTGWVNSVALLLGLVLMTCLTVADWREGLTVSGAMERTAMLGRFAARIKRDVIEPPTVAPPPFAVRVRRLKEEAERVLAIEEGAVPPTGPIADAAAAYRSKRSEAHLLLTDLPEAPTGDLTALDRVARTFGELSVVQGELRRKQYGTSVTKNLFDVSTQGLFNALGAAMFSLLAVYIAAAAYRAFRVRSIESFLMMSAAVLVMLGQTPFGLWIYEGLPGIRQWLLSVPNSAAFRAIKIGAAVAALVMSFRMWLSIESESFTEEKR